MTPLLLCAAYRLIYSGGFIYAHQMPTLRQRNDGCFIIRHHFEGHTTWQIDRDGKEYLDDYNIKVDDYFHPDYFNEMWRKKLVYFGDSRKQYWEDVESERIERLARARKVKHPRNWGKKPPDFS